MTRKNSWTISSLLNRAPAVRVPAVRSSLGAWVPMPVLVAPPPAPQSLVGWQPINARQRALGISFESGEIKDGSGQVCPPKTFNKDKNPPSCASGQQPAFISPDSKCYTCCPSGAQPNVDAVKKACEAKGGRWDAAGDCGYCGIGVAASAGAASGGAAAGGAGAGGIDCTKCPDGYFMYSEKKPSCASGGSVSSAIWSPDNDARFKQCPDNRCWKCPPAATQAATTTGPGGATCMAPATLTKPTNCRAGKSSTMVPVPSYDPAKNCWVCLRCPDDLHLQLPGQDVAFKGCNPATHHIETTDNAFIVGATPEQNQTYVSDVGIRCLACKFGKS